MDCGINIKLSNIEDTQLIREAIHLYVRLIKRGLIRHKGELSYPKSRSRRSVLISLNEYDTKLELLGAAPTDYLGWSDTLSELLLDKDVREFSKKKKEKG